MMSNSIRYMAVVDRIAASLHGHGRHIYGTSRLGCFGQRLSGSFVSFAQAAQAVARSKHVSMFGGMMFFWTCLPFNILCASVGECFTRMTKTSFLWVCTTSSIVQRCLRWMQITYHVSVSRGVGSVTHVGRPKQ